MFDVLKRVVRNAWAGLWRDPPALRRALLLPVSVLMVARWAPLPAGHLLSFWLGLLAICAFIVLVVNVYRYMLLPSGSEAATARLYITFGMIPFVGLIALFIVALFANLVPRLSFAIVPLLVVGLIYFGARFSLVLPDLALERNTPLGTMWSWSKGNGWKLACVLFVPMSFGGAVVWLITSWLPGPLAGVVGESLSLLLTIFGVAMLSCAYQDLRRLTEPSNCHDSSGESQA